MREDQVVCSKCKGEGAIHGKTMQEISINCPKCDGAGILDWIENIMGKVYPVFDLADADSAVDLYYDGNKIMQTTPNGGLIFH